MNMTRFWFLPALFLMTACSTMMDRTTQEVDFKTPGAKNSMCLLDTGSVSYKVFPPEKIRLMKTDEELEVRCFADGNREKTVMVRPILSSNTLLNIGNGFAPGLALDEHTNAHYLYPDVVAVDFTNIPYRKADQPTYAGQPDAPDIENIDPKKGGVPAIYSSDLEDTHVPPARQSKSFYTEQPDAPDYEPSKPAPVK